MITFIDYKYKGIGGVGQIVVNTTLELNKRGKQTKLYCSKESYEYKCLTEWGADFNYIDSDHISIKNLSKYLASDDVIVLTHIGETELLEQIKHLNNKLVFYSVHPDTFFVFNPVMKYLYKQTSAALDLVQRLYDNNSLLIMDWPNLKAIYDRGGKRLENISYLPVPVMSYSGEYRTTKPEGITNITYLGRGNEEWKIYPLIKVLEDIKQCEIHLEVTIITDVNTLFEQMIERYVPNNGIKINYINNLYGTELEKFLFEHSTLHIAMGTSALEGAKLGIPTILIDYCKEKFPDHYKYRWMYECEDFCLAGEIQNGILPYDKGRSFKDILNSIADKDNYARESEKCYSYIQENHSIRSFVDKLELSCGRTTMTTQMYCETAFSRNLYMYQHSVFRNVGSKIKQMLFGNHYDV